MAQVSVRINGYAYMLGCADGQEEHLLALAEDIDQRIDDIKLAAGPSGEARLLLMVALVLSDELYELRKQLGQPEGGWPRDGVPAEADARPEPKTTRRLTRLARRAEVMADAAEEAAALESSIVSQRESEPPEAGADTEIPEGDPAHARPAGHGTASPDEENIAAKPGHP